MHHWAYKYICFKTTTLSFSQFPGYRSSKNHEPICGLLQPAQEFFVPYPVALIRTSLNVDHVPLERPSVRVVSSYLSAPCICLAKPFKMGLQINDADAATAIKKLQRQ